MNYKREYFDKDGNLVDNDIGCVAKIIACYGDDDELLDASYRIRRGEDGYPIDVRNLGGFHNPTVSAFAENVFMNVTKECFDKYAKFLQTKLDRDFRSMSMEI